MDASEYERTFSATVQPIIGRWRELRKRIGLPNIQDLRTMTGASKLAKMVDDGDCTIGDVFSAMKNLLADREASATYTLDGLANNLSAWVVRRTLPSQVIARKPSDDDFCEHCKIKVGRGWRPVLGDGYKPGTEPKCPACGKVMYAI